MSTSTKTKSRFTRKALLCGAALAMLGFVTTAGADLTPEEIEAARNHAFSLNAEGRCLEAMPIWEQLGRELGRADDYLDAANCAMELGDASRAVSDLWQAIRFRDQLDVDQQVFAMRSLGYQAEALEDWPRALIGWDYALDLTGEPSDALKAARAARLSGRSRNAQTRMMRIDAQAFEGLELAMYYNERAQLMRESQPGAAASYMARAIAIDDQVWRRFDHGVMLQSAGDNRGAISEFRTVLAANPDDVDVQLTLAYALREEGSNDEAADLFAQAAAVQPDRADIREDMAYALKDAGREEEAVTAFMGTVDILQRTGGDEEHLYRVRREITELERDVYGFVYASGRSEGANLAGNLQDVHSVGTVGGEINWRPDGWYQNNEGVSLFARAYAGMDPGTFSVDLDSAQLGLGAQWKPFEDHNFSLSAERLIALGDTARADWMFRARYGFSDGYDWEPVKTNWNYTSLYTDVAYIPGDNEFLGVYGQFRQGRRFRTGEGWAVTPYATVIGQYYDDVYGSGDSLEAGVGVSFSHWYDEDNYHAYRRRVDFDLEYVTDINGGSDDAFMARVVFSF